jgi:predicted O-methyltransferase YrrM
VDKEEMITEFKKRAIEFGGAGVFKRSALNIRDGAGVFERVLGSGEYRTILEIGTYRGLTAAYLANFCDRVITIDLFHGRMEQLRESFDRVTFWRHMGVADKIELKLVQNDEIKTSVVQDLDFDFAFVDGAHDRTVALDFSLTRRCGNVLFHDADDNGPGKSNHVHEFIRTLPKHEVEFIDIFALWRSTGHV